MTKSEIAELLRKYRQRSDMTGNEVIEKLKEKGIAYKVKALYNWEAGRSQPDCDTFIALCDIYGMKDILSVFGYKPGNDAADRQLTCKEELMKKIERLDETTCKIISAYIDGLFTKNGSSDRSE